jgi:hypothetical protein
MIYELRITNDPLWHTNYIYLPSQFAFKTPSLTLAQLFVFFCKMNNCWHTIQKKSNTSAEYQNKLENFA